MDLLLRLPEWLALVIVVGSIVAVSLLAFRMVHRRWPVAQRSKHNDVAGFIFAVVGIMYGVLLGFVVVIQWEQYRDATAATAREAAVALTMQHGLDTAIVTERDPALAAEDAAARRQAQLALHAYAASVVDVEFPQLAAGRTPPNDNPALARLWAVTAPRAGASANGEMSRARDLLDNLEEARALRLFAASDGLPTAMWLAIGLGGVLTIGFACMFGTENLAAQTVMIAALAGLVGVLGYVALELDHSFVGHVRVEPAGFEQILHPPSK
jgi:hypothetical protein